MTAHPGDTPPGAPEPVLELVGVRKAYAGRPPLEVLHGVDLTIRRGELLGIVGPSGSGKSTLLHLMGLLDAPDAGEVHLAGRRIDDLPASRRDRLRNSDFGTSSPTSRPAISTRPAGRGSSRPSSS